MQKLLPRRRPHKYTERFSSFAGRHGVSLMMGEFGPENKVNPAGRARQAAWFTGQADAAGIHSSWWDCGCFALTDRNSGAALQAEIVRALTGECTQERK